MALLVELGLLQCLAGLGEVGTGILAVAVEEEVVELVVEVVVMRDIALRTANRIVLLDQAQDFLEREGPTQQGSGLDGRDVAAEEVEQVVDVAVLHRQVAIHVSFAEREARTQYQANARPPVM